MKKIFACAFILMSTASFGQSHDPREMYVRNISYGGTGCPQGSVAVNLSEDAKAFTLMFDDFVAEAGPMLPLSQARKFCQLMLDLDVPLGWQFSLLSIDTRGYLELEPGAQAMFQTSAYFQGNLATVTSRDTVNGPQSGDFTRRSSFGISQSIWSPCGINRALNIKTSTLATGNPGRRALIAVDSIDGEFFYTFSLLWRRCS